MKPILGNIHEHEFRITLAAGPFNLQVAAVANTGGVSRLELKGSVIADNFDIARNKEQIRSSFLFLIKNDRLACFQNWNVQ